MSERLRLALGWEDWDVSKWEEKGSDYRFKAEYEGHPTRCPKCGKESPPLESNARRKMEVRDVRMHQHRVGIIATVWQWKCGSCGRTFVHRPPELARTERMTTRLLEAIQRESFERRFQDVAELYGVSEATVRRIFQKEAKQRASAWKVAPPKILGIDEVHVGKRRFVAANLGVSPAALIDMLEDRYESTVEQFLRQPGWAKSVWVVAMDMWNPYRIAVRRALPKARIVVDKFHVLMMANRVVDRMRDGVVRYGSSAERTSLKGSRQILRRRRHGLDGEALGKLKKWRKGFPELVKAYELKEALHEVYGAKGREEGGERLEEWRRAVPRGMRPDFRELLSAVRNWRREILRYFETEVTNAATERLNRFIRLTNEMGNGYSFGTLRAKMLYASPVVMPEYWKAEEPVRAMPGSMGFLPGLGGSGGEAMGVDLEWLIGTMEDRKGVWARPDLER